jgi:hypothetical protein
MGSRRLCVGSLVIAALVQAIIIHDLRLHPFEYSYGATAAFGVIAMMLVACAMMFALEAASATCFVLAAAFCLVTGIVFGGYRAPYQWILADILLPISVVFAIGFVLFPSTFKRLSLGVHVGQYG